MLKLIKKFIFELANIGKFHLNDNKFKLAVNPYLLKPYKVFFDNYNKRI